MTSKRRGGGAHMITVINLTNVDFVGEGKKYPSHDRVFNIIHVVIFDASEVDHRPFRAIFYFFITQ